MPFDQAITLYEETIIPTDYANRYDKIEADFVKEEEEGTLDYVRNTSCFMFLVWIIRMIIVGQSRAKEWRFAPIKGVQLNIKGRTRKSELK